MQHRPGDRDFEALAIKARARAIEVLNEIANGPDANAPRAERLLKRYAKRGELEPLTPKRYETAR